MVCNVRSPGCVVAYEAGNQPTMVNGPTQDTTVGAIDSRVEAAARFRSAFAVLWAFSIRVQESCAHHGRKRE